MRFQIVDVHGNVILDWDAEEIAATALPRPIVHRFARRKFLSRLVSALEAKKLDLFAL